ncbi:MAG: hypothetical protein KF858_12930 [Candidatus Sumerlaeia bacterium]|nr:hypothetical protein [Candidatus Sumerlaeia bacterium]
MFHAVRTYLVAAFLVSVVPLGAQQQPATAVNQQDEVVTINLAAHQGPDDVLRILRSSTKQETNTYTTKVFELRNTGAYEMLLVITQAVGRESGIVRGAITNETPRRQFLVVTTTRAQMPEIAETISALDVPGLVNAQGRTRKAIRLKYRRASDLARVLQNTRLTSQAKIFADDLTNTLYYDDSDYVMSRTEDYATFFDVPIPQIEFDVQIIEVHEDNASKLGLDWDAWKRTVGGQIGLTANRFEGGDTFARLDGLLTLDAVVLAQFLNYTVQSGTANLVQRSRLTASNLQPAVISDRRRVPFHDYTRTAQTGAVLTEVNPRVDAAGEAGSGEPNRPDPRVVAITPPVVNRLGEVAAGEEGIAIAIQPVIGTEAVTADVRIAVNTITGLDQLGRPIVAAQDLSNQFTLINGQQLLLGTLERETAVKARSGIPGLKDVPVIQYLVSVETERRSKSRLFIIANPTFRHVGFQAATLADVKTQPVLRIEEREFAVDDAGLPTLP